LPVIPDVPARGELTAETYQPGSAEDFDRLYRTAYPRVYRTLTAILADPGAAEDCAQDAFVQAFGAWKRWRPDAPAEAWVHRIAVNRAISYRRTARLRGVGEMPVLSKIALGALYAAVGVVLVSTMATFRRQRRRLSRTVACRPATAI